MLFIFINRTYQLILSFFFFFFIKYIKTGVNMQKQINEISLKIALNLLSDYIKGKTLELINIHQKFARDFLNKQQNDLHHWLINETKDINFQIKILLQGTRDHFKQIKFDFVYEFFQKCCTIIQQNSKYLIQALNQHINKKIDISKPNLLLSQLTPPIIICTNQQQQNHQQQIVEYSKQINKDLQSLDYFLNLISYQDNKTYQQYKSQCDKILMQREIIQNIKPSQACKEIIQTANIIQNVMENSDKVFQDSYKIKYMEFKSFLNNLENPDHITELFKEEMQIETKQKFKDGMNRTLKKYKELKKNQYLKNRIHQSTQTEQPKSIKIHQKLQNLLILQKKNNQKLISQIKMLKRNKSNVEDLLEYQKNMEKQDLKQKQMQNKYKILQLMYNKKCEQLLKMPQQRQSVINSQKSPRNNEKRTKISTIIQTDLLSKHLTKTSSVQTDVDFYYHFEQQKIFSLKKKIVQLQDTIKHKDYIIQQMQAIRTFRDNFKSKKQVYSTAIRSTRKLKMQRAKTLQYLAQDDQVYDLNRTQIELSSQTASHKKKVTMEKNQNNQVNKLKISQSKIIKKRKNIFKNEPFYALDERVEDEQVSAQIKGDQYLQNVSLRSILKAGNNQFKKQIGIQTQQIKNDYPSDYIGKNAFRMSKIQRAKLNSREKRDTQNKISKSNIHSNSTQSPFLELPLKRQMNKERVSFQKSNFVALQELNDHSQQKIYGATINSPLRMNGLPSPKRLLPQKIKNINMIKISRLTESRVNTVGNQVLHVNNTLNFNFLQPINNLKQTMTMNNTYCFKSKPKQENTRKNIKKQTKIL